MCISNDGAHSRSVRVIQKLVGENTTWKLDHHDYHKKYDGYARRYAALENWMDSLGKERERNRSPHEDLKPEATRASDFCQMPPTAFFRAWK